jgi:hypothetical protein
MDALRAGAKMGSWSEGFLTSDGEYVNRQQALDIARASGQVPANFDEMLKTEDLWDDEGNPVVRDAVQTAN